MGLSTVMGIVKTHGGFLDVTSETGKGATFRVALPALTIPEAREKAAAGEETAS